MNLLVFLFIACVFQIIKRISDGIKLHFLAFHTVSMQTLTKKRLRVN
jgi:hypothetical protein